MSNILKKLVGGSLLLTQTLLLSQENPDLVNNLYLDYGYNLPVAASLSPKDLSKNVTSCLATETPTQQFYCVVGVALKTSNEDLPSVEDMKTLNIEQYREFVPNVIEAVQQREQYLRNKKAQEEFERQDKIARANYSSTYFVGIHSENGSENGLHVGYANSLDDIRYSLYFTNHSFEDYGKSIGANEFGVNVLYPFAQYKFKNIYPHVAAGAGYISVSESGYDGGTDFYLDLGADYNFNEAFEVSANIRVFDAISLLTYSSTGVNITLNYWF